MKNIVLIGMPSCGKTTIGKRLAERLNLPFIDTDEEIVKREGRSIPEIFSTEGELYFRDVESEVVKDLAQHKGVVISCGGGVVLREENALALQKNGILFFIKRDVNALSTEGRPLSKDVETLKKMEKERLPLYEKYADFTIINDKTVDSAAEDIMRVL